MRKAAHPLGGVDSLNPHRLRGKQLHHHGYGVCWLFVLLWIDSWHHELIVCKKWYKNNLKMMCTVLLSDPTLRAPYLNLSVSLGATHLGQLDTKANMVLVSVCPIL